MKRRILLISILTLVFASFLTFSSSAYSYPSNEYESVYGILIDASRIYDTNIVIRFDDYPLFNFDGTPITNSNNYQICNITENSGNGIEASDEIQSMEILESTINNFTEHGEYSWLNNVHYIYFDYAEASVMACYGIDDFWAFNGGSSEWYIGITYNTGLSEIPNMVSGNFPSWIEITGIPYGTTGSIFDNIRSTLSHYIFSDDFSNVPFGTGWIDMISTIACVLLFLLPFLIIFIVLRFIT